MPGFRRNIDDTSTVLYVGKIRKALWDRLFSILAFQERQAHKGYNFITGREGCH